MKAPFDHIPDEFWNTVQAVIPPEPDKSKKGGRPRKLDDRTALTAILFRLRTGCHWKALGQFGKKSTIYDRFCSWVEAGVFEKMWHLLVQHYDELVGLDLKVVCGDAFHTKSPKGGT